MVKVLFVCLGNICRSPIAQFVFQHMVNEQGLSNKFEIDSAGTEGYNERCHAGIDYRSKDMMRQMKVPFNEHYSRQIRSSDYDKFADILETVDVSEIFGSLIFSISIVIFSNRSLVK